jgi:hypothetical protein
MAKAAKPKGGDVIELEVIEELPLEKQIENTLVKHNVTETVILGLKEKYGGLALRSIDNKEDYLEIKAAKKDVRQYGILTERICKKGREDAIAIQKKWLAKEKEILGKIAEVEGPLEAEIKKYDDEQARIEMEEVRKRENAFAARQSELIKIGAAYMDGFYSLNHVSFEADVIKNADQETYEMSILAKYKAQYEKNEAVRVEEERKQKEAAESLRIAQEEMARKQKEMEEREAALALAEAQRLEAIRQQNEEAERKKHAEEIAKSEEAARQRREKIDKRISQLRAMGLEFSLEYKSYIYEDVAISMVVEVQGMNDADWDALIVKIIPTIERCKKEVEEKRLAQIEKEKQEAAAAAALAERQKIEKEQKEAQEKSDREAALKAEEALKATDKTKWQAYVDYHNAGVVPEMKSPTYRAKIAEAQKFIQKAVNL